MEKNDDHAGRRASTHRRGYNWSARGTKTSRRELRQNANTSKFNRLKREWNEYVASLSLQDRRTLLINIVHVLPDVTTPNRDLVSLEKGVNWLKKCLQTSKETSSVGDKNAGTVHSATPTAVSRNSAGSPSLQTPGEEHVSSALSCRMENSSSLEDKTAGTLDSSINGPKVSGSIGAVANTLLNMLHQRRPFINTNPLRHHAETATVVQTSQHRKTNRQLRVAANVQERETKQKRSKHVLEVTLAMEAEGRKSKIENRANEIKSQELKAKQLRIQKQRATLLARNLITSNNVEKCAALLIDSENRARQCVSLERKVQDAKRKVRDLEMKCVAGEKALETIKRTRVDTPLVDCIRSACIPKELQNELHKFVRGVTKSELAKSAKDMIDEGFPTESAYEFSASEAKVCTHTHVVCGHS